MKTIVSITTAAVILACASMASLHAQANVLQTPAEATWGPAPPFVPAGAQISVMSGDPGKPAPYSLRFKLPANYSIPAHSHPMDENVVIVTGGLTFGMGDKLAARRAAALSKMAPRAAHSADGASKPLTYEWREEVGTTTGKITPPD